MRWIQIYQRQRIDILDGDVVQFSVVGAKSMTSVFFLYEYYRRRPRAVGRFDDFVHLCLGYLPLFESDWVR